MSKVFIIGNGFDLDLGLKTRYIDFWNSEEFEKYRSTDSGLIKFLNIYANENSTWFDIEALIRKYVVLKDGHGRTRTYVGVVDRDKKQFEDIRTSLAFSEPNSEFDYLKRLYSAVLVQEKKKELSIKELKDNGFTVRDIEKLTGVPKSNISRKLKEDENE